MADVVTHFPPQTYSSSFFLNNLVEDEKNGFVEGKIKNKQDGSKHLLDCFINTFLFGEKRPTENQRDRLAKHARNKTTNAENKDIEASGELWKSNHRHHTTTTNKALRSESPHSAFKRSRKSAGLNKLVDSKIDSKPKRNGDGDMSLLKFLALNALDLSAPASDILLKSRSKNWFQLSGHPDSLAPAGPGTVWKKRAIGSDDTERLVYEELSQDNNLADIIPRYYREVEYQGEKFIELQDLLHGFQDPYVVDIKMGTRTFLESEVQKTSARHDLYQKMIAIDPNAPTAEEHSQKAVTKLRYMQFREQQSSSCSHGFRIEAMKCRGLPPVTDLKKVKCSEEVFNTLDMFLGGREEIRQRLLRRLNEIRSKIEQSEFFKTREVVGASLFIIYDDAKIGVWLIDFAKTSKLPDGTTVNHREEWVPGNHEEGLLFGFDRLINVIESINTPSSRKSNDSFNKPLSTVSVKS